MLEAVQRGIERALLDEQRAAGHLLDPLHDRVAAERAERDGLEDQEVEGAGEQVGAWRHGRPFT